MSRSIRVLIVDDSPFMRYILAKHLEADPDLTVVGSAQDGHGALTKIPALRPDVVTLDVEMPRMDGLTTLQRIISDYPIPVVMLSSLTQHGPRTTIKALMRGAVDFVAKPTTSIDIKVVIEELIAKIKVAANVRVPIASLVKKPAEGTELPPRPTAGGPLTKVGVQPFQVGDPVIVIGGSTGGPRALQRVFADFPADLPAAIIVVQHMPPGFTTSLGQRLNEMSPLTIQEAVDGDRLRPGLVLLAPGDRQLCFRPDKKIGLHSDPHHPHLRPAVDVTMKSAVEHYHSAVIGVVLTGLGSDGLKGAGYIKAAGGRVIAEHKTTSVVYDMPRSVIEAGYADQVVPLPDIASTLVGYINNGNL